MRTEEPAESTDSQIEELTADDMMEVVEIPSLYTSPPPIRDALDTETSKMQDETLDELLPFLKDPEGDLNVFGMPQLVRQKHKRYLKHMLEGPFPSQFVAADASRPWMLYWALAAMTMLDVDVTEYRER